MKFRGEVRHNLFNNKFQNPPSENKVCRTRLDTFILFTYGILSMILNFDRPTMLTSYIFSIFKLMLFQTVPSMTC